MKHTNLNQFVAKVMNINAGVAGMGASSGIIGASGTNNHVINQLRDCTMAFAAEYVKTSPDSVKVTELSRQLEGALHAAGLMNGLSKDKLVELVDELHDLQNSL